MRLAKALQQISDEDSGPTLSEVTALKESLYLCRSLFPTNFAILHEIADEKVRELLADVAKRRSLVRRLQECTM